jgi:Cu(I)/Ag(I) efflux system membrane fusion protein
LLYEIYSEEIVATQQEFLNFLEGTKNDESGTNLMLAETARNKLLLWGLSEKTITQIQSTRKIQKLIPIYSQEAGLIRELFVNEGEFVMEGAPLFSVENLSTVWVEAQCNVSDLDFILPEQKVLITFDAFPGEQIQGTVSFVRPELTPQSRITMLRCNLNNRLGKYLPGMQATVSVQLETDSSIVLPVNAVIQGKDGSFVWIQNDDGTFQTKMVETGLQHGNQIEITWGIRAGKKVVTSGVYLLNSEYILKNGTSPMEGHDMSKM